MPGNYEAAFGSAAASPENLCRVASGDMQGLTIDTEFVERLRGQYFPD